MTLNQSAVVPFNERYPVDFIIMNVNNQSVLYIDDIGETLHLEITNTSELPITIPAGGNENPFELRFRPGTLARDSEKKIVLDSDGWKMSAPKTVDGIVSLFIYKEKEENLNPGKSVTLTLVNVMAYVGGGSHGTRVELHYQNLVCGNSKLDGYRVKHMAILNHHGRKHIPLHVGFVERNKVLNDGSSNNTLMLRITNTLKYDAANPDRSVITFQPGKGTALKGHDAESEFNASGDEIPSSKLIFSFVAGDINKNWALGSDSQLKAIQVDSFGTIENIVKNTSEKSRVTWLAGELGGKKKQWNIRAEKQGENFELILAPCEKIELSADDYIEFTFSNIITNHPSGYTNLYVHYRNIPGYWDGQFVCSIEKTRLMVKNNEVDIKGDLHVDGNIGIGTTTPADSLHVNGNAVLGLAEKNQKFIMHPRTNGKGDFLQITHDDANGNWDWSQGITLQRGGNVGIGTTDPKSKLHVNGNVLANGNVGIGISTPLRRLDVRGQAPFILATDDYNQDRKSGSMFVAEFGSASGNTYSSLCALSLGGSQWNNLILQRDTPGNVGIGTTNPTAKLEVNGDIKISGHYWANVTDRKEGKMYRRLVSDRNYSDKIVATWESDIRLKCDFVPIKNALDKVTKLFGVTYQWNEDGLKYFTRDIEENYSAGPGATEAENRKVWDEERNKRIEKLSCRQVGLVAQDVEPVIPEAVDTDNDGYKSIDYGRITALLVEAIKDQKALIDKLTERIAVLEGKKG